MNGLEHRTTRCEFYGLRAPRTEQVVQARLGETRQPVPVTHQPAMGIAIHQLVYPQPDGYLLRTAHQADQSVLGPEADCQAGGAERLFEKFKLL
jgi:hypothetical protein